MPLYNVGMIYLFIYLYADFSKIYVYTPHWLSLSSIFYNFTAILKYLYQTWQRDRTVSQLNKM